MTCARLRGPGRRLHRWSRGFRPEGREAAVRWGRITTNPAKLAGPNPQPRREEVVPFTREEVDAIAAELGDTYGPMVVLAAETGLRPSELLALERRDLDKTAGAITVERPL